jgi:predicted  nucleic acid-binding Zn-ribbon protein
MEQANSELTLTLTEKQREISKLQISLQQVGKDDLSIREIDGLRQHNSTLCTEIEAEKDKLATLERKLRQIEIETRAATMTMEDEKQRYERTTGEMNTQIATLEDKIRDLTDHSGNIMKSPSRSMLLLFLYYIFL